MNRALTYSQITSSDHTDPVKTHLYVGWEDRIQKYEVKLTTTMSTAKEPDAHRTRIQMFLDEAELDTLIDSLCFAQAKKHDMELKNA